MCKLLIFFFFRIFLSFSSKFLIFFFGSYRRVDFRELVRDLFSLFKTRIWMQKLDINGKQIHSSLPSGDPNGPPVLPQLTHLTARYGRTDLANLTYTSMATTNESSLSSSPPLNNDNIFNDILGGVNNNGNLEDSIYNDNLLNWSNSNQITELEASAEPYIPQTYQIPSFHDSDHLMRFEDTTSTFNNNHNNMNGQQNMSRYEYETKKSNINILSKSTLQSMMRNSSPSPPTTVTSTSSTTSSNSSQYMQPNQMYLPIRTDMEPVHEDRMFYESMYGLRKDISPTSYNLTLSKNINNSNGNNINNMNQFNQMSHNTGYNKTDIYSTNQPHYAQLSNNNNNNNNSNNNFNNTNNYNNINYYSQQQQHHHQQQQQYQHHPQNSRSDLIDEDFYISNTRPPLPISSDPLLTHHQHQQYLQQHQYNNNNQHYQSHYGSGSGMNNNNGNNNYLDFIAPSYSRSSDSNFSDVIIPDEHLYALDTNTTSGPLILE